MSKTSEYGLIAVGYIALHEKGIQVQAPSISEKYNIPLPFLLKILGDLTKGRVLLSKRGPRGGYVLAREPEKISLLDIIMAVEDITSDHLNFLEDKSNEPFLLKMEKFTKKAESELKKILSETTLADMIGSKK